MDVCWILISWCLPLAKHHDISNFRQLQVLELKMLPHDYFAMSSRPHRKTTVSAVSGLSIIEIESIDRELQEMIHFFVSNHGLKIRAEHLEATGQRYRMEIMKLIGRVNRNNTNSIISTESEILDSEIPDSEMPDSVNSLDSKRSSLCSKRSSSSSKRSSSSSKRSSLSSKRSSLSSKRSSFSQNSQLNTKRTSFSSSRSTRTMIAHKTSYL